MTDQVAIFIQSLPRHFKSKFINACIKVVMEDELLLSKAKSLMIDLPMPDKITSTSISTSGIKKDNTNVEPEKKISSSKVKFKF